jgi:hypothetical protein
LHSIAKYVNKLTFPSISFVELFFSLKQWSKST